MSCCLGSPKLLFSNRKDIQLTDSSLVNSNSTVLLAGLSEAAAVDFLYEKDKKGKDRTTFCWTEHYEGIFCATSPNLDNPVKIVSNGMYDGTLHSNYYVLVHVTLPAWSELSIDFMEIELL